MKDNSELQVDSMTGIIGLIRQEDNHEETFRTLQKAVAHRGRLVTILEASTSFEGAKQFSLSVTLGDSQKLRSFEHDGGILLVDASHVNDELWSNLTESIRILPFEDIVKYFRKTSTVVGYVILGAYPDSIRLYRSQDGALPLYYTENNKEFAFSTERKGLFRLADVDIHTLQPSETLSYSNDGLKLCPPIQESYDVSKVSYEIFLDRLEKQIWMIFEGLRGVEKCGVLFSGGIDSSLVALMASQVCDNVVLFSTFVENSHDEYTAMNTADVLDLPIADTRITMDTVWEVLPEVIYAIETGEQLQVEIALPFFIAAKTASRLGHSLLLSGQGPDELFAGYAKHVQLLREQGEQALDEQLRREISVTHEVNLARDERAVSFNGGRIFFPYFHPEFVKTALQIPSSLKITLNKPITRKVIFRKLAQKLGLPVEIALRAKKATQYSSGATKILLESFRLHCDACRDLSKKESIKHLQALLNTMAQELGIPVKNPSRFEFAYERRSLDRLIQSLSS